MAFNELNSVEHYIVHQLSGVNLNKDEAADSGSNWGSLNANKTFYKLVRWRS
ncbi:hypothetical protein LB465_17615 [Salegentibacter sp. LM13S]|uniref:hypothetical protein n=1 Tax=Salegentibacter lacus TaxID=2873599 RepID=UPI001CC9D654|nr:hypothetical protein [Salegentibacter lacus]MBZ9632600.1 hypothetical protein [Salegentibacter lacus]